MKLGAVLVAVVSAALVLGLSTLGGATVGPATTTAAETVSFLAVEACALAGPLPGLDPDQAANAEAIVAAAMAASKENEQAVHVALMAAMTESSLHNLDHGDRDSLGLFQERPSQGWGTPAQVMDPAYATTAFVTRLLAVPAWSSMPPWLAAEAVERSAFLDGSNYRPNWGPAGAVLAAALDLGSGPQGCGQGGGGLAGPAGSHGLPAGYAIPAGTPPGHGVAIAYALAQLGKPYVWGASGPSSFDCSGLTMAAWARAGVTLTHYTGDQQHEGAAVAPAAVAPGDLVLTPGSDQPAPGVAGHVGIYLGDDLVLSAIDQQMGVAVQTWATFVSGGLIAVIDPAPGT